jgi:hypothetical protein
MAIEFGSSCSLGELIEALEELRSEFGDDAEVRLMTQQNWPFENSICRITTGADINANDESYSSADEDSDDDDVESDNVIYIVEGQQLGYGSKAAWTC